MVHYDHQGYGKKQIEIQAYDTSETLGLQLIVDWYRTTGTTT